MFSLFHTFAGSATPPVSRSYDGVGGVEQVSPNTVGFSGVDRRGTVTRKNIFSERGQSEMLWINTSFIPTGVVDGDSVGNRSNESRIGDSVNQLAFSPSSGSSIASGVDPTPPHPATRLIDERVTLNKLYIGKSMAALSTTPMTLVSHLRPVRSCNNSSFLAGDAHTFEPSPVLQLFDFDGFNHAVSLGLLSVVRQAFLI